MTDMQIDVVSTAALSKQPVANRRRRSGRIRTSIGRTIVAYVTATLFIGPFLFMLGNALKTNNQYAVSPLAFPRPLTLVNFRAAWTVGDIGQALLNSVVSVCVGVAICTASSVAGAFWLVRHGHGPRSRFLLPTLLSFWVVPQVIYLLPMFVELSRLHLTNNLVVLGVVYASANAPFSVWMMTAYFKQGSSPEVMEAAAVDGASTWQQFVRVAVPMTRPGIATVISLLFVFMWSDLLTAVILMQDPSRFTATVAAASLATKGNLNAQVTGAASLLIMVPMLIVFLVVQRAIVRGFAAGVGK